MTNWLPDLAKHGGPRYRAIAEALAADVREGRLPAGTRLPPQRDLAWRLRVTTGTVSRAYAEAERRGLIAGEVGRGTFVRPLVTAPAAAPHVELDAPDFVDLRINRPRAAGEAALLARSLAALSQDPALEDLLQYQPHLGHPAHREAGAAWIGRAGLATTGDEVAITASGQHAIACVLAALVPSGESVAVEALTYPGVKAAAAFLNLRLVPVAMDEEGLLPEAFAAACAAQRIRALYTLPTLHNPTTATMGEERRRAIAEVARHHGVAIVEDDVYGFLLATPPTPLASFAPELGYYLTSASKSLAPGLRIGYVHAPAAGLERIAAALRATLYMATPLMAAIAARWINDGTADHLAAAKRAETARRQALARTLLAGARFTTHPASAHLWLALPESWRSDDFAAAARRRGVGVTPAAAFAVGSRPPPNAVRIGLGTPASAARLERGLAVLIELLGGAPDADLSVV